MNRWKNLMAAFSLIPILPEGDCPEWHLSFVAGREISHIGSELSAILDKGVIFKAEVDFFTPIETEIVLTKDEKGFLNKNRKAVLWLLQMDELYQKGMFNYENAYLQFDQKYLQRFTALCNIRSSRDTAEQRMAKALYETTRRWFIIFCSDYKQVEQQDETGDQIIRFERPKR